MQEQLIDGTIKSIFKQFFNHFSKNSGICCTLISLFIHEQFDLGCTVLSEYIYLGLLR